MKDLFAVLIFIFFCSFSYSQDEHNIASLKETVNTVFEGMRKGDSSLVRKVFRHDGRLLTVAEEKGIAVIHETPLTEFLNAIGSPHEKVWDERIVSWKFTIDGKLAVVSAEYLFFHGAVFTHCGINVFQLIKSGNDWKIFQITDTRRTDCVEDPLADTIQLKRPTEILLSNLLDNWHRAAARGDLRSFADLMGHDFIYLGTDKTERWKKEEFVAFCKPYFERAEGGWDFKPLSRMLYFSDDLRFAWFEEHLDTWMGTCRGSGVFSYTSQGWKLMHYNLCMTISNDDVKKVLEVTNGN